MYMTEVLNGRPYQCFVPVPMFPAVEVPLVKAFSTLDRRLKERVADGMFATRATGTVAQIGNRIDAGDRAECASAALRYCMSRPRIGVDQLKKTHALLTGKDDCGFRTGPVWMGGPHPADAWHVGAPPSRLNGLMKQLIDLPDTRLPATLQALLGFLRILQIHPFADGNGRLARCHAICLTHRGIGPATALLDLLDHLCDRSRFDLNAASIEVQNSGRFEVFLSLAHDMILQKIESH